MKRTFFISLVLCLMTIGSSRAAAQTQSATAATVNPVDEYIADIHDPLDPNIDLTNLATGSDVVKFVRFLERIAKEEINASSIQQAMDIVHASEKQMEYFIESTEPVNDTARMAVAQVMQYYGIRGAIATQRLAGNNNYANALCVASGIELPEGVVFENEVSQSWKKMMSMYMTEIKGQANKSNTLGECILNCMKASQTFGLRVKDSLESYLLTH